MFFCLSSYLLSFAVFLLTVRRIYTNTNTTLVSFGYTYFYLSFAGGVLNCFLFRWIMNADFFTSEFYQAFWLWNAGFFLFSLILYQTPKRFWSITITADTSISGHFVVASFVFSFLIQMMAVMAFLKSGTIPILSREVEVARSQMHQAGGLNQAFFLMVLVILLNGMLCYLRRGWVCFLSALIMTSSFIILFMYGMRNYILVSIFGLVFFYEIFTQAKVQIYKMLSLSFLAGVFLYIFGIMRGQLKNELDLILISGRLFSGVFSEFREWPDIISQSAIEPSPFMFFNIISAVVPSSVFQIAGVDKTDVIFSSGIFYKEKLGRIFAGDNLGLRTSLYGDFYVMFGLYAFLLLPVFYYLLIRCFNYRLSKNISTAPFYLLSLLTIFIGFSSELSTLLIKLYFLFGSMIFLLLFANILERSTK